VSSLESVVPPDTRLVIDSSVLIAYLTAEEPASPSARILIDDLIGGGRNDAVISVLAVAETLVRPTLGGSARSVAFELIDLAGIQIRSVDVLVGAEAARIRGLSRLPLPDAVIIATGVLTSSAIVVTNDTRLAAAVPQVVPEMAVVLLSDLV
jgi:predicted nucleic acid-binding protein